MKYNVYTKPYETDENLKWIIEDLDGTQIGNGRTYEIALNNAKETILFNKKYIMDFVQQVDIEV